MLEGLDDVDWGRLTHAFGPATDVPALLRGVAAGGEQAQAALSDLFGTVWHQGSVYEASSHVVPFLTELALADQLDTNVRQLVLALIVGIGRGRGYWQVHSDVVARISRLPDDVDAQLIAESNAVEAARAAADHAAHTCLSRINDFPADLWLDVACMSVVARDLAREDAHHVLAQPPPLPEFGERGVQALRELLATGHISGELLQQLTELDEDVAAFVEQTPDVQPGQSVPLDSYLVDVLTERLADTHGRGTA